MPTTPPGMSFPVTSCNPSEPLNCIIVPFKSRTLMPEEQAKSLEGNLIRETRSKARAAALTNYKLQLQQILVIQRMAKE
jgi:hypothetical protein